MRINSVGLQPRREFLKAVGIVAAGIALPSCSTTSAGKKTVPGPVPVIDAHTHFFDTPPPPAGYRTLGQKKFYQSVLPDEFVTLTKPFNVKGTVVIEPEASMAENDWELALAEKNPVIVGYVARLTPGKPEFANIFDKYQKNPLFLGIRIFFGMVTDVLSKPQMLSDLKLMADAGREIDVAGGPGQLGATLLELAKLNERIPNLRMVLNHLPMPHPNGDANLALLKQAFAEMKNAPHVYVKLSQVIRRAGGQMHTDLAYWRGAMEEVYEAFGPDRVIFGSNWPACLEYAEYPPVMNLVQEYFADKGRDATEKFFWKNSLAAYRWVKRSADQPGSGPVRS
jgi:L-fuconolactonase